MKKRIVTIALVVALLATCFAGTYAYLTDTAAATNTMVLGNVKIEQWEYERELNTDGTYKTATIDERTSYVLKGYTQDKPLYPIVGDPNEPGNSPAYAGFDATTVRMTQVGSYGGMQVFAGKNAQDKFVVVKNAGKTDAYVRTIVAIEIGSTAGRKLVMTSGRAIDADKVGTTQDDKAPWIKASSLAEVTINGNTYMVVEYVYRGANDVNRHVDGVLPAGDTTYPSLCQVYLKHYATNEDMINLDGNNNGKLDVLVLSQAVQAEGFANAQTALDTAFGDVNAENLDKWF